jgi:hypothetical protein
VASQAFAVASKAREGSQRYTNKEAATAAAGAGAVSTDAQNAPLPGFLQPARMLADDEPWLEDIGATDDASDEELKDIRGAGEGAGEGALDKAVSAAAAEWAASQQLEASYEDAADQLQRAQRKVRHIDDDNEVDEDEDTDGDDADGAAGGGVGGAGCSSLAAAREWTTQQDWRIDSFLDMQDEQGQAKRDDDDNDEVLFLEVRPSTRAARRASAVHVAAANVLPLATGTAPAVDARVTAGARATDAECPICLLLLWESTSIPEPQPLSGASGAGPGSDAKRKTLSQPRAEAHGAVRWLPCAHAFHADCLSAAFAHSANSNGGGGSLPECPTCGTPLADPGALYTTMPGGANAPSARAFNSAAAPRSACVGPLSAPELRRRALDAAEKRAAQAKSAKRL